MKVVSVLSRQFLFPISGEEGQGHDQCGHEKDDHEDPVVRARDQEQDDNAQEKKTYYGQDGHTGSHETTPKDTM